MKATTRLTPAQQDALIDLLAAGAARAPVDAPASVPLSILLELHEDLQLLNREETDLHRRLVRLNGPGAARAVELARRELGR